MEMADYLIIGNGAAGRKAAEKLREADRGAAITVLTSENCPYYMRPRLSLGFIAGELERDAMFVGPDFYSRNAISLVFGIVSGVAPARNRVLMCDGSEFSYRALLIATGASAVVPPWKGCALDGVVTLRTLADAESIIRRSDGIESVVVAGGGILGCEIAESLLKRGKNVKLLVRGGPEKVGAPALTPEKAEARCDALLGAGVDVVVNDEIECIIGNGKVEEVLTGAGTHIACGLVVATIGSRPNIGFLEGSGIRCGRGVVVDSELRCPDFANVFAAGDAAELSAEDRKIRAPGAPWMNAVRQGEFAAARMVELLAAEKT